jgi:hypothetical protein
VVSFELSLRPQAAVLLCFVAVFGNNDISLRLESSHGAGTPGTQRDIEFSQQAVKGLKHSLSSIEPGLPLCQHVLNH